MTLDTSQRVGIGTSSPASRLSFGAHIPSDGQTLLIYQDANTRSGLGVVSGVYRMFTDSNSVLSFGGVSTSDGSTYTERVRINASGNIGVGVTPSAWDSAALSRAIQFNAASIYSYQSTNTLISHNGYYDGTWKYYNTGPTGRINIFQDQLNFDAATSGTQNTAITYTTVFTVARGATFALQGGSQSNGTGIAFPATASPSSNANTLDDYEEGTWTPAINYGGTVATLSVAFGFYVKVGRHVTLTGYLTTTNKNGGTGDAVLSGLPFPIGNSSNHYPGGSLGYYANLTLPAGTTGLAWYGIVNSGSIYLGYNSTTNWAQLNGSLAGNNAQYGPFTICYISD
jgi:hypothetical protein